MSKWISESIENQPEVGKALRDLSQKIHEYKDAANPKYCRGKNKKFLSAELDWFRPGWNLFTIVSIGFGLAGGAYSLVRPSVEARVWADLTLTVTVPVFVLGISLVTLARSMSESGRFAVEYLNESCKMAWFCCLTLVAVLIGLVGRFVCTIGWFPNVVTVAVCASSLGAAIDCLAMLAFVVRETVRCSDPSESIKAVSQYAARKLCYAYLKEAYLTLLTTQRREYLKEWCAGKNIHPPSQYYGYYFSSSLHSGEGVDDVEIKLNGRAPGENEYRDYDMEGLAALDKYLKENNANLYLSSTIYENKQGQLGILSSKNMRQNERLREDVSTMGREIVRLKKVAFVEENENFWDSQESKLDEAVERAIDREDTIQLRAYLDAVNEPLSVLRHIRNNHKVVRDAFGQYVQRGYDFIRLYLRALNEIMTRQESEPKHRVKRLFGLASTIRKSVWDETKKIFENMDYHTMELFTWLVLQMYKTIQDAKDEAKSLYDMRAQFGGFYEFAVGWLEDRTTKDSEDADKMRLVLHDGFTKWLLIAIKDKDTDLIEQLCNAGREIVFGRESINFTHREAVAQHFVLAGRLISMSKAGEVNATAVERLFFEQHSHSDSVDFDELVRFYLDNTLPLNSLDSYMNIFYSPNIIRSDLFTGSSHSSGFGMTGIQEVSWAFIFIAANALSSCGEKPDAKAGISGRITSENIKVVEEIFQNSHIHHGFEELKGWLKACEELDSEQEAKEIAEAEFDEQKVTEWKRKFWEGYIRAIPVLSFCLKNGNFKIDNNALFERRYILPKIAFFNWKYPLSGAEGDEFGIHMGQYMEQNFLSNVASKVDAESEVKGDLPEVIRKAVSWLEKEGANIDAGIIFAISKHPPDSELYREKNYIPSWKEDVPSKGFDGFYKGYPIVWLREENENNQKVTEQVDDPKVDKVLAVDFRNWTGIRVREELISKKKFGDLVVREWTKDEINNAIESGKLEKENINKAKRNCPVDVSLFWMFSSEDIPKGKIFSVFHADVQKE
ncbi:MAG: hypothetical protein JXA81_16490 [Sedimentisphaerales bacterium]|nr:hypothetical protein [Sedimentisphaerales bacterium]